MEGQIPKTDAMPALEAMYTIAEVAAMMKVSDTYARRIFQNEPGVLHLGHGTNGRRRYFTMRVPHSVFERVIAKFKLP